MVNKCLLNDSHFGCGSSLKGIRKLTTDKPHLWLYLVLWLILLWQQRWVHFVYLNFWRKNDPSHTSSFFFLIFGCTHDMWDVNSLPRDQTPSPCIGKWSVNPWTTKEVLTCILRGESVHTLKPRDRKLGYTWPQLKSFL